MNHSTTGAFNLANRNGIHAVVFLVAMLTITLNSARAQTPHDYWADHGCDTIESVSEFSAPFHLRPPRRLRDRHLGPSGGGPA